MKYSKKIPKKYNCLFTIILILVLFYVLINKVTYKMGPKILLISEKMIETQNDLIFKKAYAKKNEHNTDVDNIVHVNKNKNNEIIDVNFNIAECEKILLSIIYEMNNDTNAIMNEGQIMWIPMGYTTNNPLLINLGPKIPVKIETTDVVLGDVSTKITEFGINNALAEVYINIKIKITTSLPFQQKSKELKYSALLASKIISGKVPVYYGGMFTREKNFNLSIDE